MLAIKNYKPIFQALPTASIVLKPQKSDYEILEANNAYLNIVHCSKDEIINSRLLYEHLPTILEKPDTIINHLAKSLSKVEKNLEPIKNQVIRCELATVDNQNERFWQFIHTPILDEKGGSKYIIHTLSDVTDLLSLEEKQKENPQKVITRSQLHSKNEILVDQISKKITQYETASQELNDFIYSVSHDLRAPLRRIDGFSQELINEYVDQLDEMGAHYLRRVRQGTQDMGNLIDDLLKLSRISRRRIDIQSVDLTNLAKKMFNELIETEEDCNASIDIEKNLQTQADRGLVKVMLQNLLFNALKFTSKENAPTITIGKIKKDKTQYFFIKDNGVGFDPAYSDKLFRAFDRLHSQKEFKGSGIGLATVKRIVNLHGGTIWAEGKPGKGATFYFNLQRNQ